MPDSLLPPTPAAPAAPVSPAAAPSAARARGLGKLHLQRPAVHFLAVELLDRGLGLIGRRRLDRAGLGEQLAQPLAGCGEGQAADEELLCHRAPPSRSSAVDDTPWNAEGRQSRGLVRRRSTMNRQPGQTRLVLHICVPAIALISS